MADPYEMPEVERKAAAAIAAGLLGLAWFIQNKTGGSSGSGVRGFKRRGGRSYARRFVRVKMYAPRKSRGYGVRRRRSRRYGGRR